jgi:hypothetical protein
MTGLLLNSTPQPSGRADLHQLLRGDIALETRSHTAWGAAVTVQMYLPRPRLQLWPHVTNYPRWVDYLPNLTHSTRLTAPNERHIRLHQRAAKRFLMLSIHVDIDLRVFERCDGSQHRIQFCMERGSFSDFYADLILEDCDRGSLLTYRVSATPSIPVPSHLIQQAIRLDLPHNLQVMRRVLCESV